MIKIGDFEFKTNKIDQALTHSSYSKINYERLEFLGDSILDFLVAEILFNSKDYAEDELTRARASLVSEDNLSQVFDSLDIEANVKLGKSCPNITKSIKADIIEAIIACIYLESGIELCKQFILKNFKLITNNQKDYKTQLQEFAQKYKYEYHYDLEKTDGPAHDLTFYVNLYINNKLVSKAHAKSKSDAQKECAKIALENFNTDKK